VWQPNTTLYTHRYESIAGRITADKIKDKVGTVLNAWHAWSLFPPRIMTGLEATFNRRQRAEKEKEKERALSVEVLANAGAGAALLGAYGSDSDEDGEPLTLGSGNADDDDLDGVPLGAVAKARVEGGGAGPDKSTSNKRKRQGSILKGKIPLRYLLKAILIPNPHLLLYTSQARFTTTVRQTRTWTASQWTRNRVQCADARSGGIIA
jgi:hypothetical protein